MAYYFWLMGLQTFLCSTVSDDDVIFLFEPNILKKKPHACNILKLKFQFKKMLWFPYWHCLNSHNYAVEVSLTLKLNFFFCIPAFIGKLTQVWHGTEIPSWIERRCCADMVCILTKSLPRWPYEANSDLRKLKYLYLSSFEHD